MNKREREKRRGKKKGEKEHLESASFAPSMQRKEKKEVGKKGGVHELRGVSRKRKSSLGQAEVREENYFGGAVPVFGRSEKRGKKGELGREGKRCFVLIVLLMLESASRREKVGGGRRKGKEGNCCTSLRGSEGKMRGEERKKGGRGGPPAQVIAFRCKKKGKKRGKKRGGRGRWLES